MGFIVVSISRTAQITFNLAGTPCVAGTDRFNFVSS